MIDAMMLPSAPDRRQVVAVGGLIGAIVLILGVGSGLGLVVSEKRVTTEVPSLSTSALAQSTPEPLFEPLLASQSPSPAVVPASPAAASMPSQVAVPLPSLISGVPTAAPAPGPGEAAPAQGCSAPGDPMTPLNTHLKATHLEESPGQQVTDLLDVNQYTLTHTALVEHMLFGSC